MRRELKLAGWVVLLLALGIGLFAWQRHEAGQLSRMDPAQRHALYERTFGHFRAICSAADRPRAVERLCTEEAALLRRLPECDAGCRQVTEPFVATATK